MGKAILAFVPDGRLEELIERIDFAPRGPNTLTDPAAFREELRKIRAAGIAVNDEELAYGLRSIASPICSQSGEAVAALEIAIEAANRGQCAAEPRGQGADHRGSSCPSHSIASWWR
jgi:IclR family pca regulon transcriptional regulator